MAQLTVEFIRNGRVVAIENTDVPDGAEYIGAERHSGNLLVSVEAAMQGQTDSVAEPPGGYDRFRVSIDGRIVAEPAALV